MLLLAISSGPARSTTLEAALAQAFRDNPTVTGARSQVRTADDEVEIARAQGRPTLNANGEYDEYLRRSDNDPTAPHRLFSATVGVSLPVYRGGAIRNGVRAAIRRVWASRGQLDATEQQILLDAVGAYMDVLTSEATVALYENQIGLLQGYVDFSRAGLRAGSLTKTDVAQSRTRLSLADASLLRARGQLDVDRENYLRVIGGVPIALEMPADLKSLPATPDEAVRYALDHSPQLAAAQAVVDANGFDVSAARAARLPVLSATGSAGYNNYFDTFGGSNPLYRQTERSAVVGLRLTVPLYQGGLPTAQVRRAQSIQSQAIEAATATERAVITQARGAYSQYLAALRALAATHDAVAGGRDAVTGMTAETKAGTREVVDLLNAEQDLLNAQVAMLQAQRDVYVDGVTVLATIGSAKPEALGFAGNSGFDPRAHLRSVSNDLWDFGEDRRPAPVASSIRNMVVPHAMQP